MKLKLAQDILAAANSAKQQWDSDLPAEIKASFKQQHDAFLSKDNSVPIAEGAAHFYAAMEHGEEGLLHIIGDAILGESKEEAPTVSADGEIEGNGKYQTHDPGWTQAFLVFLEHVLNGSYVDLSLPALPDDYTPTVISNNAKIAVIGDWGTGYWQDDATPAAKVAQAVNNLEPDVVIHLGDVYYDGSESEVADNLVSIIPQGKQATFNLNSNHDMYSASVPYFKAVKQAPFGHQGGTSYFALTNDDWVIVGLDTAYLSTFLNGFLYGSLGQQEPITGDLIPNAQTKYLSAMAQKAANENKKLIIMSHHNAYDGPGLTHQTPLEYLGSKTLWAQVSELVKPYLDSDKLFWYWGHAHCAYVMKEIDGILARCVGHGAVPWGKGSDYYTDGDSNLEWFESTPMPNNPPLLMNGLMSITLSGNTISEEFLTQDGVVTYTANNGVMTAP